jgi:hypothetical protein
MDRLLTNKYFCIAILIALAVVLFLYSQKDSCNVEPMQNLNLTPLSQELNMHPWTDNLDGSKYGRVDTEFNAYADDHTKKRLQKSTNFLPRSDVTFMNYAMSDSDISDSLVSSETPVVKKRSHKRHQLNKYTRHSHKSKGSYPQPIDMRPDLSQCQPCAPCPVCDSNVSGNKVH